MPEVVIFVGLPAAGKSTFFRQRFAESHALVSKDLLRNNRWPARRQDVLLREALAGGRSVVVDNTSPSREERAPIIAAARAHGARVVAYHFDEPVAACRARNARRTGRGRVPEVAIYTAAKRLQAPHPAEGLDAVYRVRIVEGGGFLVEDAEHPGGAC